MVAVRRRSTRDAAACADLFNVVFAAGCLAACTVFVTGPSGDLTRLCFWSSMAVAHIVFAASARRLSMANQSTGRQLFRFAGFAGVALTIGDFIRLVAVLQPARGDALNVVEVQQGTVGVAMVLLVLGLLRFPLSLTSSGARARLRLDVAIVMAAAVTAGLSVFELPAGRHDVHWLIRLGFGLMLQPGLFLLTIFAILRLAFSGMTPFGPAAARTLSAAAVLQALLQAVPDSAYQHPRYSGWLLAGNLTGSVLIAVGMRVQHDHRPRVARTQEAPRRLYSVIPYAATACTWILGTTLLLTDGLTWRSWVVYTGVAVTTALVISRQVAAFRHIAELLDERDLLAAQLTAQADQLSEQAYRDELTGLPNRAHFLKRLTELLAEGPVTVFLIDLNGFKPINDTYGHATGDQLLIEVGNRLRSATRAHDSIGRLGGDEFAVAIAGHASHRLHDLTTALNGAVKLGTTTVTLSASVGHAEGANDPQDLLHRADLAMYAVKRHHHRDSSAAKLHALD